MRVAQMIDTINLGGAQKMQIILAEAMRERNVEVTLVSLKENTRKTDVPRQLQQLGVNVHYFPGEKLLSLGRLRRISRFLRQGQYDLVHAHLAYANIIGTISGRMAGIPTIASFRSVQVDRNPVVSKVEAFLLRHVTTRLMAVGNATAAAHQHRVGHKTIAAIPNSVTLIPPISHEKRLSLRRALVGNTERPILIAVGRLTSQKGLDDLVTALAAVRQHQPDVALLIAGYGPLHDQLAALIGSLNLREHAWLLGPRNDVPDLLAASDIFVSSSHWEGLSNALLEAMAAGLPIIATDNSDTPNVVVEGTGLLVPAKQPTALANAILTLLEDPDKRCAFGRAAREHMAQEYNLEQWTEQILALWRSAIDGRRELP